MLTRVPLFVSINIITAGLLLSMPATLRPAHAQSPHPTAKPTCLVKYSTLSAIMCETATSGTVVAKTLTEATAPSTLDKLDPSLEQATQDKKESTKEAEFERIREVKGVKTKYIYTDRVSKDKEGPYTKMREKADEDSKRLEILRPGDKVRVVKNDKKDWYFVQIFKSHDTKLEGKDGWIERWLIDDVNVPEEPTPTPSPTKAPTQEGQSSESTPASGNVSTSGDGEALFSMVNDYRTGNGLGAFEKSERLCSIARERAPEIAGEVATGSIHSGFAARGYGFPVAVENAAGYGNIGSNFNFWINSGLHRGSILGPDLKYSCVECSGGNCVQIFSPNP